MLPWEAKARTLAAPYELVQPLLELLRHHEEVMADTVDVGPDDFYDDESDPTCPICAPR